MAKIDDAVIDQDYGPLSTRSNPMKEARFAPDLSSVSAIQSQLRQRTDMPQLSLMIDEVLVFTPITLVLAYCSSRNFALSMQRNEAMQFRLSRLQRGIGWVVAALLTTTYVFSVLDRQWLALLALVMLVGGLAASSIAMHVAKTPAVKRARSLRETFGMSVSRDLRVSVHRFRRFKKAVAPQGWRELRLPLDFLDRLMSLKVFSSVYGIGLAAVLPCAAIFAVTTYGSEDDITGEIARTSANYLVCSVHPASHSP